VIPSRDTAAIATGTARDPPDRWAVVPAGLALVAALALGVYLLVADDGTVTPLSPAVSLVIALLVGAAGVGLSASLRDDRRVVFGTGVAAAVVGTLPLVPGPQAWVVALLLLLSATLASPTEGAPDGRARFLVAVLLVVSLAGLLLLTYRAATVYRVPVGALLVVLLGGAMLSVSGALGGRPPGSEPE
jgi:hypothetical protein